ncbi:ParA family protein [Mucilaginibacter aquariorum]|uniref:ParA family protein n=1 Tax=Mucilaginibacter aquariorum TaxID=2967225 RepID=A0ABT1SZ59_9SPHI|nr:ParA family protein [Mucilaginibacter aquariorum]MCQ6957639.1 ParA family protein [Mucilaginibacter aquariorum]
MVIIIGNQKGGAGKSTLTLLLANYLTQNKSCRVTVLDMDYQQSISQKFEKAKILENTEPYDVLAFALSDFPVMAETIKHNPKDIVLIDLPGKLDDDGLIKVFKAAQVAVCPFAYDEFSFESTVPFALVLKKINPDVHILFVPNRIKANVKYEIKSDVNEQLNQLGLVTAPIADRIDFQRTNTFQTPLAVQALLLPVFDRIFKEFIHPYL